MSKKRNLGQFYTKNADYILQGMIRVIPEENAVVVDPFAGEWDILKFVRRRRSNSILEAYDLDPQNENTELRDSLLNPPDYEGKYIATNPPYLARNKCGDKTIFEKYETDDLYKAAIRSFVGFTGNSPCEGGFMVVPLNFFCDRDDTTRKFFLSKYEVSVLNIFEEQVFNDTTYTVCSFSFRKKENTNQRIRAHFHPSSQFKEFRISSKTGYRIGSEFFRLLNKPKKDVRIGRLVDGKELPEGWHITNLYLRAIDTGSQAGRIALQINKEHFYAKESDRTFATIISSKELSREVEECLVDAFNVMLEEYRNKYCSLFLTNFRNSTTSYARKRIDFKTAFKMIEFILNYEDVLSPNNRLCA